MLWICVVVLVMCVAIRAAIIVDLAGDVERLKRELEDKDGEAQ